jgi:AcrR family transcriptional regulator
MTEQRSSGRARDPSRRQARAHRILDAAAALILRWGYNKTTIDDIARQAGVAKGTIYLHWTTREELFGALVLRERLAMAEDFAARVAADPLGATLSGMMRHTALALLQRPLLKAIILRDLDVLGKLAQHEQSTAAYASRLGSFQIYLEFLREHNLMRSDRSIDEQTYALYAIFMGFFLTAPLMPTQLAPAPEQLAELLAEAIHRALELDRDLAPAELELATQTFQVYLDRAVAAAQDQLRRSLEPAAGRSSTHE